MKYIVNDFDANRLNNAYAFLVRGGWKKLVSENPATFIKSISRKRAQVEFFPLTYSLSYYGEKNQVTPIVSSLLGITNGKLTTIDDRVK